jgi:hypothetical protein
MTHAELVERSDWIAKQDLLPDLWRLIGFKCNENEFLQKNEIVIHERVLKRCLRSIIVFMDNVALVHPETLDPCLHILPPLYGLEELEKLWIDIPRLCEEMPCVNCEFVWNFCILTGKIVMQVDEFISYSLIDYSYWSTQAPAIIDYTMMKVRSHLRIVLGLYISVYDSLLFANVEAFDQSLVGHHSAVDVGGGWKLEGEGVTLELAAKLFLFRRLSSIKVKQEYTWKLFHSTQQSSTTYLSHFLDLHVDPNFIYIFSEYISDNVRQSMFTNINEAVQNLYTSLRNLAWRLIHLSNRFYSSFMTSGNPGATMNWYGFVANTVFHILGLPIAWSSGDNLQGALVALVLDWMRLKSLLPITDPRFHRWAVTALDMLRQCSIKGYLEKSDDETLRCLLNMATECTAHLRNALDTLFTKTMTPPLAVSVDSLSNIDRLRELHNRNIRLIGRVIERPEGYDNNNILPFHEIKPKLQKIASIGRGSFGQVYEAIDLETGSLVAVKELRRTTPYQLIKSEADILKSLSHPNILEYYGVSITDDSLSIVTEFCSGGSLHRQLQMGPIYDERLLKNYCFQILSGLQYIHTRAIIHRDIKPENILIDRQGVLKISDFGAIKASACTSVPTSDAEIMIGTPAYMAPEAVIGSQAARSNPITTKVDIWSFGCTLLFMITGRRPWYEFDNDFAILYQLGSTSNLPKMPQQFIVPDECVSLMMECLTRNPRERPTAQDLVEGHRFLKNPASFKYYY